MFFRRHFGKVINMRSSSSPPPPSSLFFVNLSQFLILLLLLTLHAGVVQGDNADVVSTTGTLTTFVPPAAYSYRSQILYIEHDDDSLVLPPYHRLSANLIRPPPTNLDIIQNNPPLQYDDRLCDVGYRRSDVDVDADVQTNNSTSNNTDGNGDDGEAAATSTIVEPTIYQYMPVAMLVRLGGCTLRRKLEVAVDIRANHIANDTLWSIMFYNDADPSVDDPSNLDAAEHSMIQSLDAEMSHTINATELPDVDQFIFSSVSYRTGRMIISQMERTADRLSSNNNDGGGGDTQQFINGAATTTTSSPSSSSVIRPELFGEGNAVWRFPVSLERGSNPYGPGREISPNGDDDDDSPSVGQLTFIWFRFILFGLLACFPCFRFVKMWFAAGGRILFRRNDNNRIIGLYIQQPSDESWLSPYELSRARGGHGRNGGRTGADRQLLTKEQVMEELPEIQYTRPSTAKYAEDEEYYHHNNNKGDGEDDVETGAAPKTSDDIAVDSVNDNDPIQIQMASCDDDDGEEGETDTAVPSGTAIQSSLDIEIAEQQQQQEGNGDDDGGARLEGQLQEEDPKEKIFTATTSTTCSICIDEFEEGELVRLLPRCGHAYHTECILPWLTERQGCCPLCKNPVLPQDDDGTDSEEQNDDSGEDDEGRDNNSRDGDNSDDDQIDEENQNTTNDTDGNTTNNQGGGSSNNNEEEQEEPSRR